MLISNTLKTKRADILDRLSSLSDKASDEKRELTASEQSAWDAGMREARDLEQRITREEERETLRRGSGTRLVAIDDKGERHPILRSTDKLAERHPLPTGQAPVDLGKIVVGLATGDWPRELRDMNETLPGAGGYTVPTPLSALWLDLVRSQTVMVQAGVGMVDMQSDTLKIARIVGDVAPTFTPEGTPLATGDVAFGQVLLNSRRLGVVTVASIELLADSPNAGDMITRSLTASMALALDQAGLSGDGVVDATHDHPTGILATAGIGAIPVAGPLVDYDHFLDGMLLIEAANLEPDGVVMTPNANNELRKLKTGIAGDLTKLRAPADYDALPKFITTGLAAGNAIIGDWDMSGLYGLRTGVTIEASRLADQAMKNAQVLIRAYARADFVVIRPAGFTKLTGIA